MNEALEAEGIHALETDLAELIVQLAAGRQAVAHPRAGDPSQPRRDPCAVRAHDRAGPVSWATRRRRSPRPRGCICARSSSRCRWRSRARTSAIAETGTIGVVESEGNGRMCLTLPKALVTIMGIEKVLPSWQDLEVFLQLLPRSSTAERMNPYTSLWTGVRDGDGPQEFHLVLLDGGRTDVLADEVGRAGAALHPLLGVPERLPGLRARRRPGLRVGLSGSDRRDPDAAAERAGDGAVAAVGVVAVRRVLRGLPGQDRHPLDPRAPARPGRARGEVAS